MTEPLVSVIVPVYNVAPFIREAIESVIGQTYSNLEIIVVDDGSTDGSGTTCDEYVTDPRVKVIHQKNRGLSGARNAGLDAMTGDIVAFLDSDDAFCPEMIANMFGVMAETDADIVICDFLWDDRTCHLERKTYDSSEALRVMINGKMELAVWNKIYKKKIWDGVRFPEGHIYEGTRTTYKLLEKAKRIEQVPDCLMFHRTRPGSIVQTKAYENSMEFFRACREYEGFVMKKVPTLLSKTEYEHFMEWRFSQKIPHWLVVRKADTARGKKLRKWMLRQIQSTKTWGKKSIIKYLMFRCCPGMLILLLKLKDIIRRILSRTGQ